MTFESKPVLLFVGRNTHFPADFHLLSLSMGEQFSFQFSRQSTENLIAKCHNGGWSRGREFPRREIIRAIHFISHGAAPTAIIPAETRSVFRVCVRISGGADFPYDPETAGNSIIVIDYFGIRAQSYFRWLIDRSNRTRSTPTKTPGAAVQPTRVKEKKRERERESGSMEMTVPLKIQR